MQKVENCNSDNPCAKRCPKCKLLPREYKPLGQTPLGGDETFSPEDLWDLILSPLHVGLRGWHDYIYGV